MGKLLFILSLALTVSAGVTARPDSVAARLPEGAFPFEYFDRHLYIDMVFNDTVPGKWVFDSGAVNLYPDSTEFAGYTFERRTYRRFRGAGQNIVTLPVVLDTVTVDNGFVRLTSTLSPLLDLKKILGQKPAGIVGTEMIRDHPFEINYSGSYMRLLPRSALPPDGYAGIPIEIHPTGLILIPLKLRLQNSELFEGRFVYDTGSGGMLSVNTPTVAAWGLDRKITEKIEQYTGEAGIGGESHQFLFRASAIIIGGYEVRMPLVDYSLNTDGVSVMDEFDGIAGNLVLEQFDHILDIAGERLYIRPGGTFGKEFRERVAGFHYIDRRDLGLGFVVMSMDVRGSAERAGLLIGDVITHINGVHIDEGTIGYFDGQLQKPYIEYVLTVFRDGELLNIRIRNSGLSLIAEPVRSRHGIIR